MTEKVTLLTDSDAIWKWEDSKCSFSLKTPNGSQTHSIVCDPFPCYSHDKEYVLKISEVVEKSFTLGFPSYYYLLPFEEISRTNGNARKCIDYNSEEQPYAYEGMIVLSGKRIPIHPAMTRYLVAHEYGHLVDNWICYKRGLDADALDEEYAKMRNIPFSDEYGGRKWHTNIGEIIANDFRIVVAGVEDEFFPHDCIHPHKDKNVIEWWENAVKTYSFFDKGHLSL
jgi:hypothetical protein